jgi:DNA-binding ferritin-like protein
MTEFEQKLLQHLERQAEQLTALSLSQSQTTQQLAALSTHQQATSEQQKLISNELLGLQTRMGEILQELQKEPSGESLEKTLTAALQPLNNNLEQLIESFNKLSNFSQQLSEQLPPQQKK